MVHLWLKIALKYSQKNLTKGGKHSSCLLTSEALSYS